jgi:hypothetical protein
VKKVVTPAAEVRPAADLAALAAEINSQHRQGEEMTRTGLEHFRRAGEALLKAKAQCGHGRWMAWLEKNVRFSRQQAAAYMRVADRWHECKGALHLTDALRILTQEGREDEATVAAAAYDRWAAAILNNLFPAQSS